VLSVRCIDASISLLSPVFNVTQYSISFGTMMTIIQPYIPRILINNDVNYGANTVLVSTAVSSTQSVTIDYLGVYGGQLQFQSNMKINTLILNVCSPSHLYLTGAIVVSTGFISSFCSNTAEAQQMGSIGENSSPAGTISNDPLKLTLPTLNIQTWNMTTHGMR
jgi:hypothetical protein